MISVIIPTLTGGLNHLVKLIPGLSDEPDKEIIVIDNYSRDGTTNYLQNYECKIKVNKQLNNFSKSNNMGAKMAEGDTLLFLNNDTQIQEGLLQEMQSVLNSDKNVGVVGSLLYLMDYPRKVQHAGVMFTEKFIPYELGLPLSFGVPEIAPNDPRINSVREVPSVTGACMMIKKDLFDKIGGFDEEYNNGWEDTDLVLRVKELGYKVFYTGRKYVLHKHFGSKDRGRFTHENKNRQRYEEIWVNTGRAKNILKDFIYG